MYVAVSKVYGGSISLKYQKCISASACEPAADFLIETLGHTPLKPCGGDAVTINDASPGAAYNNNVIVSSAAASVPGPTTTSTTDPLASQTVELEQAHTEVSTDVVKQLYFKTLLSSLASLIKG